MKSQQALKHELEQMAVLRFAFEAAMFQLKQMQLEIKSLSAQFVRTVLRPASPQAATG